MQDGIRAEYISMAGIKGHDGIDVIGGEGFAVNSAGLESRIPPNPRRLWLLLVNSGTARCTVYLGPPLPSTNSVGLYLNPGASITFDKDHPWCGQVWAATEVGDPETSLSWWEASIV